MSYCGQCGVDLKEEVYVDKTEEAFDRLEDGVEERDDDSRRAPQRSSTAGSTIWHCGECDSRVAERDKFCPHCGAAFVENEETSM